MIRCQSCFHEYEGTACPHCGYPEKGQNASHQLPVGTVLRERYQIGRCLGQGGFGITYLAWDKLMQQTVAVKEFYPSGTVFRKSATSTAVECGTEEIVPHYEYSKERFLREANALVRFKDIPEVVDILDFARENNTAYIVMEFVRGLDLKKYIAMRGGKLTVEETFRILKPVMEALAKVHKAGIVHRDISPDNIILDPMGGAKLLDFGAVRTVGDPKVDKELTQSTEAIIKHGFAPLEQYNARGSLGPWTDEYAMCATVWYCLAGTVPEEVTIRMTEGTDPDWSSIEGLPEHQRKALEKGISCRAKDRYRSMDELLAALFPGEVPEVSPEEEKPEEKKPELPKAEKEKPAPTVKKAKAPAGSKEKEPAKKRTWIIAAAAVLLLLIAAVALIPKTPKTAPEEPQLQEQPETTTEATQPTTEPISEEERQYLQADQLLTEGKFQEAIDIFTALGEYKDSSLRCEYAKAELLFEEGKLGDAAIAFYKLGAYTDAKARSFAIWDQIAVRDTIDGGQYHTVGLKVGGTVVAVGSDYVDAKYKGARKAVEDWTNIVAICAGDNHTVGLRDDGTVVAVGYNEYGQCDVENWTDIVAISAGRCHTVGLRADGTVVAVGANASKDNGDYKGGPCDVEGWTDIVSVSAGRWHTVGLKSDGTVVAVGSNYSEIDDNYTSYNYLNGGPCDVEEWTDIVAISAGGFHTVGFRADGSAVAVGNNGYGNNQCAVEEWTDIVALSAGMRHTAGLRADGTVTARGWNQHGQCDIGEWRDVAAVVALDYHTVVLFRDGTLAAVGASGIDYGQTNVGKWTDIQIPQERVPFR